MTMPHALILSPGESVYIDLNPIKAKIAKTPEESKFTGAFERIHGIKKLSKGAIKKGKAPDLWLAPIRDTTQHRGFLNVTLPEYLSIPLASKLGLSWLKRVKLAETAFA